MTDAIENGRSEVPAIEHPLLDDDFARLVDSESTMTSQQREALVRLVKERRPKAIMEAGVQTGSRTVLLMETALANGFAPAFFGQDASERCFRDRTKPTGYLAQSALDLPAFREIEYRIYRGVSSAEAVRRIAEEGGAQVDFIVLDSNVIPGEVVDLLACVPIPAPVCQVVILRGGEPLCFEFDLGFVAEHFGGEEALRILTESNSHYADQALETRQQRSLLMAESQRKKGAEYYRHLAEKRQEGLEFYKKQLASREEGLEFYKKQLASREEGLEFYKKLLASRDEGIAFYKRQSESRQKGIEFYKGLLASAEEKRDFYKDFAEGRKREVQRCRDRIESQQRTIEEMKGTAAWQMHQAVTWLPRHVRRGGEGKK